MKNPVLNYTCEKCLNNCKPNNWLPPAGLDPHLREFECENCHLVFYKLIGNERQRNYIDENIVQADNRPRLI